MYKTPLILFCLCAIISFSCASKQEKALAAIQTLDAQISQDTFQSSPTELWKQAVELKLAYLKDFPEDTTVKKQYLQNVIDLSMRLQNFQVAETAINTYLSAYPNDPSAANLLFTLGFYVHEQGTQDLAKAKATYELILNKYPESPIVEDVLFSLESIGKSESELLDIVKN